MFEDERTSPACDTYDTSIYGCGQVGEHNVVMACLSVGQIGIVFGLEQLSTATKHTFISAPAHLHALTTTRKIDLMKRKRSEGHDHAPPRLNEAEVTRVAICEVPYYQ